MYLFLNIKKYRPKQKNIENSGVFPIIFDVGSAIHLDLCPHIDISTRNILIKELMDVIFSGISEGYISSIATSY